MTVIALCLTFVLITVAREYTLLCERRETARERSELLNRVQAPDRLPAAQIADFVIPEPEPDEFDRVGMIFEPVNADG
jgi:hypothetical protein